MVQDAQWNLLKIKPLQIKFKNQHHYQRINKNMRLWQREKQIEVFQREKKFRTENINDKKEASAIKSTSKQTDQIRKVITWGKVQ